MRAIIDIKGKQYEIEEGRYFAVDRYPALENEEVILGNVCMVIAGEQSVIGTPFVSGASVKVTVKRHYRGSKVLVYKMRCKKGYRRKNGYRHDYTELQVVAVDFPGRESILPLPSEEKPKKSAQPKTTAKKSSAAEPVKAAVVETTEEKVEKPKTTRKKTTEEGSHDSAAPTPVKKTGSRAKKVDESAPKGETPQEEPQE